MLVKKITIPLVPVTKKNAQRILVNRATGKPFVMPSEKYKQYEEDCRIFLRQSGDPIAYPVNVRCLFYVPTRRRVDLSNLISAIDDILVKYGILEDDNRDVIAGHDGSRVFYDKKNPRTEIYITKMEDYDQWKN